MLGAEGNRQPEGWWELYWGLASETDFNMLGPVVNKLSSALCTNGLSKTETKLLCEFSESKWFNYRFSNCYLKHVLLKFILYIG